MSTIRQLVSRLAKKEGKKHQASVGDVREIVGLLCDELYRDELRGVCSEHSLFWNLYVNGRRRAQRTALRKSHHRPLTNPRKALTMKRRG